VSALVLFDIDGTLLLSGGAGVRAMARAFEETFGVANAFEGISVAGHTDTFLVRQALVRAGLEDTPDAHERFRQTYLALLPEEIVKRGTGRKAVMPGVHELLTSIAGRRSLHSALLTGNYERAAQIKLEHFGLAGHFEWGAFGDEAADRNELGRLALRRAVERAIPAAACGNAVVVGDTPQDIACARAMGARVIAVATGMSTVDELRAAGADAVLTDLSDTAAVIALLIQ
jgi:phosphoglycolate phosphatase